MYPKQARIICQARSKSLDIKEHRSYKYTDLSCRKCQTYDETLTHVINCGKNTYITVDTLNNMENDNVVNLKLVAKRINDFIEEVG